MTTSRVVRGIGVDVVNTRPDIDTALVLARLDAALAMIEQYQPWRLAHLRRDVARVLVQRFACRGAYFPDSRTCLTELTFLANPRHATPEHAASIVHEGMHARVHAMTGTMTADGSAARAREERLCRRAELELGLVVPHGEVVVQRALASLELDDVDVAPVVNWREAAEKIRRADQLPRREPGRSDRDH
jgi:hypothetical protein